MGQLIELRGRIIRLYAQYETYAKAAIRFVVALLTFLVINGQLGYMSKLKSPVIAILLAAVCTFLPIKVTVILAALVVLVHLLYLSTEVFLIAFLLFAVLFFLYFRYVPKRGFSILMTVILGRFGIAEIMPTTLALCQEPWSVISMVCGMIIYYFLKGIHTNAAAFSDSSISGMTLALDALIGNKEMYLCVAAFVITALVIYFLRRKPMAHGWLIAIGVGNGINLLILVVGSFWAGTTKGLLLVLLGTILALAAGVVELFFLYHLDYRRVERIQFEDDEYYYFVKAVPKVDMAQPEKKIKRMSSRAEDFTE